jgi:NTP pyrophosphatase (non-canonical NTP hydrolase)
MQKTINEYQEFVKLTQKFPQDVANEYLVLGLVSEAGEVAGVWKRVLRQDTNNFDEQETHQKMVQELGDVLWYVTALCLQNNTTLENLIEANTKKLSTRLVNGTIKGKGDER